MVTAALVESAIVDGAKLILALDEEGIDVPAALWFYDSESEDWRLLIASGQLQHLGPQKAYAKIQAVLEGTAIRTVKLSNVSVVSPSDPIIRALRVAIHTGPGITGIRFSRNVINSIFIEDAYIYRVT
jgi:hypothetical protein